MKPVGFSRERSEQNIGYGVAAFASYGLSVIVTITAFTACIGPHKPMPTQQSQAAQPPTAAETDREPESVNQAADESAPSLIVPPFTVPPVAQAPAPTTPTPDDVPVLEVKPVPVEAAYESYKTVQAMTATKTDTPIMETPVSVQVVPQQVLKDQQAVRLETALENVSGVIQAGFNQGSSDGFLIRGFGSNNIYRNGVFMPDALGGGTTKREVANIDRVEVLKGPGSILYGRTEPGGIINTVTKQPLATPYYSLQQQFGSYSFYRTAIDATGPLTKDDTVLYRFNMSYENSGSFRDFVDKKSVFLAPVVRWNLSPRTQISAEYEYHHFNEVLDPGIPPLGNRPAPVSRSLYVGEPLNSKNVGDRHFVGLNWSHQFTADWTLSHRLSAELFDFSTQSLFFGAAAPDGSLDRFFNNAPVQKSNRYQTSLNLTGHITTGVLNHTLLVGYDYFYFDDKFKGNNCCTAAPAFNIFSPPI
ncbi:MAG: Ferrichrome-iron receptor [Nitrospira sp.]|nr:MAG: Ferrichrome-iron receptor [Nitrospira sp.]